MKIDYFEPGVVYRVFNRGNNKEDIFKEEKNYMYFLSLLQKYVMPVAEIYAYCLMKNHFHLLVRINPKTQDWQSFKDCQSLYSQAFSNMFSTYTKTINKNYNRSGSLFEKNFKRILIDDDRNKFAVR